LIAEATLNLTDLTENPTVEQQKNYLDLNVGINGYPLELARYWVGGSVSDIDGLFNARLNVVGPTKKLDVSGYIDALDGGFTIDYLQTRYRFAQSRVRIDNKLFDLAGTRLYDRLGNVATLSGGVTHDRLKNLGLNARINTENFLALDLAPGQNPLFFGTAIGTGYVTFTGNFRQPDIYVAATVGRDSKLSIPVDASSEAGPINNVRFRDRSVYAEEEDNAVEEPTGVSLKMDLSVTDEAVGEIIFDADVGDILRGQGNGNLQLNIPRDGDLEMFGTYNITEGSYLFTFQKIISINKEFSVRPGGKVTWTGDPFLANLDIEADYEDLKTSILPFIQEYLVADVNQELSNAASRPTEVDLTLKLNGLLTQPDINFDLSFPTLDGQLETYANNKRRLLLLDQTELNRQVFGLIVAGQFLPSDLSFSGTDAAINTVSEWLSSYFSLLLNDLLKNAFGEDAFISSFEFDLAYNTYRNSGIDANNDGRSSAFEFSFRRDFNNRWTLRGDVNVLNNQIPGVGNTGTFVGNDVVIEYILNDSRSLKLRVYQRLEPDIAGGRRLQVGTGLSWRREFDTLREFFAGFKKDARQK
ncbi:MAG: translocation/assembly module TamB domain-containing protein, partial [Bacteroidota bacterium]